MAHDDEFTALRRRAETATASELAAVAESLGWRAVASGTADAVFTKAGREPLTIPRNLAHGEARNIIAALEAEAAQGGE